MNVFSKSLIINKKWSKVEISGLKWFKFLKEGVLTIFIGQYEHNIDKKGRMFIPAKFKEGMGESFIVAQGLERKHCLFIYTQSEWSKLEEKISAQPYSKSQKLKRFLYSGAAELECDAQGRVLLPQTLRQYAGLTDSAVIVGTGATIEIWNKENWERENQEISSDVVMDILEEIDF